jgi:hypothetical protein
MSDQETSRIIEEPACFTGIAIAGGDLSEHPNRARLIQIGA